MKTILVTGASGFVGRKLCSRLIKAGHRVFGLSAKRPDNGTEGLAGYYEQDLAEQFHLNASFDVVIHLAAYNITHVGDKDQDLYTRINVEGTRHLLQGVRTKRFIYLSTAKVYKNEGLALTEDSPVAAAGAYESSKWQAEEVIRKMFPGDSQVIMRSVNIIGEGQAFKAALPVFFERARKNQPLEIIGAPQTLVQFVYVEDIVDAFESVLAHESVSGIFNIASEQTATIEALARQIIALTGSLSPLNSRADARGVLAAPVVCEKALRQLGWKAKTDLIMILKRYAQNYAGTSV